MDKKKLGVMLIVFAFVFSLVSVSLYFNTEDRSTEKALAVRGGNSADIFLKVEPEGGITNGER